MILADSNLLILASKGSHPKLARFLVDQAPVFSAVSYVETLGYHALKPAEQSYLEQFFLGSVVLPINDPVLHEAVRLRQTRKMALGDALIAGTALVHGCKLATRNVRDFHWISGLDVVDPLAN